jgi:WD40-like Beta Propeller Repeat
VVLAALSVTVTGCDGPRQPWRHQLASVTADGTDAGGAVQLEIGDERGRHQGRFRQPRERLRATDANGTWDVYVRDLTTATTMLVSVDAAGTDAGNGRSTMPTISADGTRIAFLSEADDLGPTDSHRGRDVPAVPADGCPAACRGAFLGGADRS